jgi:hypothetical protein
VSEPTVIAPNIREWWDNGALHRTDGPACEGPGTNREWWVRGKRHRTDGPAAECDGFREWWVDGKLHRTDGPASEHANGDREWYVNGVLHRTDGPAVEYADGAPAAWFANGVRLLTSDVAQLLDMDPQLRRDVLNLYDYGLAIADLVEAVQAATT